MRLRADHFRYYEALRFPTDCPARLRRALPSRAPVLRVSPCPTPARGPGVLGSGCPMPVVVEREPQGVPSSCGTPPVPTPCSSTPAGPATPCREVRRRGPRSMKDEGSPRVVISGLQSTAWALAVYASPRPLPGRDARLAFGRWPGSTGWACLPTGFLRKVSEGSRYISSPFPKLAWRSNRSRPDGDDRIVRSKPGPRLASAVGRMRAGH
jgi:hypothetical protein